MRPRRSLIHGMCKWSSAVVSLCQSVREQVACAANASWENQSTASCDSTAVNWRLRNPPWISLPWQLWRWACTQEQGDLIKTRCAIIQQTSLLVWQALLFSVMFHFKCRIKKNLSTVKIMLTWDSNIWAAHLKWLHVNFRRISQTAHLLYAVNRFLQHRSGTHFHTSYRPTLAHDLLY